ncbi:hypothetical protein BH20ACT14_BH20ACT14_19150 [soil metagenome]
MHGKAAQREPSDRLGKDRLDAQNAVAYVEPEQRP